MYVGKKHSIYRVWYYVQYRVPTRGLGMYSLWVSGENCNLVSEKSKNEITKEGKELWLFSVFNRERPDGFKNSTDIILFVLTKVMTVKQ